MGWVRIDDKFPHHPKLLKAGPLGLALHVAAICYCNQHLTDGFVPRAAVVGLLDFSGLAMRCWDGDLVGGGQDADWQTVVEDLVAAGLWHSMDGGWAIHDYLDFQPSKTSILEARAASAHRQTKWRNNRKAARNGVSNGVSNGVGNGHVTRD